MAKQTWVLVSLSHHRIEKDRRGRAIVRQGEWPADIPNGFDRRKNSVAWEPIYERVVDPKHTGKKPIYELRESQTARVTEIVGPKPPKGE
jgi:hypothetical protein